MLIGFARAYDAIFPSLPSCTSDSAKATIGNIFKDKNVERSTLTNQKSVTDIPSEKTCQADVTTAHEAGTLSYRISWQGKEAEDPIAKVNSHPC